MKVNLFSKIILIAILVFALVSISALIKKQELINILKNKEYSYGLYIEDVTSGRGGRKAKYEFKVKNEKLIQSTQGKSAFKDESPIFGNYYVVAYDNRNPKSSILFLNLEVNDTIGNNLSQQEVSKLLREKYDDIVVSYLLENLSVGFIKYFPPYYTNNDLKKFENNQN